MTPRTVRNRLREVGRYAYKPIRCQILSNAMKQKRLQWAHVHKDWTLEMWSSVNFTSLSMIRKVTLLTHLLVMFSDKTMIELQPPLFQFVHRSWNEPISEMHLNQKAKHSLKLIFCGCMSSQRMGRLHLVEGLPHC